MGLLSILVMVLLVFMFAGFYALATHARDQFNNLASKAGISTRVSRHKETDQQQLNVIINILKEEGFFEYQPEPRVFIDPMLSEAISECSSRPKFFWGVSSLGIRVRPNKSPNAQYNYTFSWHNNSIGFNWQGPR